MLSYSAEDLSPDFRKVRILVNHDGHVHWEPGGVFTTTCDIDIRYFPFDDQSCPIQIGAWAYYRSPARTQQLYTPELVARAHNIEIKLKSR